jgi:iron(III) transport system ATP-binding protein
MTASVPPHDRLVPGRAIVAVRPESIRVLTDPGDGGPNGFEGTIADATFLGNLVDYQVDVGGVLLRVQADRHLVREVGTKVFLEIPVNECVAMSGEAQE